MKLATRALILATLTLGAAALPFAAAPARFAAADPPPGCPAGSDCIVDVTNYSTCAVNSTVDGQTCVRHIRLIANYTRLVGSLGVVVDHEDSTGNVNLLNTVNTWESDRDTVTVLVVAVRPSVGTYGYLSFENPPYATTAQAERDVFVMGIPVGANVMVRNNEPVYCNVLTPTGVLRVDCSLRPVYELLPG